MGEEAHPGSAGYRIDLPDPQAPSKDGIDGSDEAAHPSTDFGASVRFSFSSSSLLHSSSTYTSIPPFSRGRPFALRRRSLSISLDTRLTFSSSNSLVEFGVSLSPVTKTINGRILPPPTIEYSDPSSAQNAPPRTVAVQPSQGAWQMRFSRGQFEQQFVKGASVESIGIIVSDERDKQGLLNFLTALLGNCFKLGSLLLLLPSLLLHNS